jgi:LysR family glycine cleavage system transcriptional activator
MDYQNLDTYPLPLSGLRHFYWAGRLQSFKKAANALNVSEAAISQQIRNLEARLKVKLFVRGHQKVDLTEKGRQLFPYVQTAFINFQDGIRSISADPAPNRLSVSTIPSFATNWLIRRLSLFNQLHPKLTISMDTSLATCDFENSPVDVAIRYGSGKYPGLRSELLMIDPTVLVCHPKHLKGGEFTREHFLNIPSIIGTTDGVMQTMQIFKDFYSVEDEQSCETLFLTDGSLGVEAARSGQGISLQRLSLVYELIESGELAYGKDFASAKFSFYAVAPDNHFEKPKVKKFLSWLKSEMDITTQQIAPFLSKIKHKGSMDVTSE